MRPRPPINLSESLDIEFIPAPELLPWVQVNLFNQDAKLHNADHAHLIDARLGFLWASMGYARAGRLVLGQTEDLRMPARGNGWQRARAEQQMRDWFPNGAPDFLITLDAAYCDQATDAEFCALVEHELYHIAQDVDEFGSPKFSRDTGEPKLRLVGHDVEEFVGVVRRYGVGKPDSPLAQMVKAATDGPQVAGITIAHACGNCLRRVA
jgi:hypothetical protein